MPSRRPTRAGADPAFFKANHSQVIWQLEFVGMDGRRPVQRLANQIRSPVMRLHRRLQASLPSQVILLTLDTRQLVAGDTITINPICSELQLSPIWVSMLEPWVILCSPTLVFRSLRFPNRARCRFWAASRSLAWFGVADRLPFDDPLDSWARLFRESRDWWSAAKSRPPIFCVVTKGTRLKNVHRGRRQIVVIKGMIGFATPFLTGLRVVTRGHLPIFASILRWTA